MEVNMDGHTGLNKIKDENAGLRKKLGIYSVHGRMGLHDYKEQVVNPLELK
jgi:hypothetical protein